MKYYHYLSKSKVEMLHSQTKRARRPIWKRLSPKLQWGGLTLSGEVDPPDRTLIAETEHVLAELETHGLLRDMEELSSPETNCYWRSLNDWRHGLF